MVSRIFFDEPVSTSSENACGNNRSLAELRTINPTDRAVDLRGDTTMASISRRTFGALGLGAATAALSGRGAFAQSGGASFMSFTFAEEPNKPFIDKLIADFKASSGHRRRAHRHRLG
jgi:hypothetical protein